jgi:hypothetical protein
MVGVTRGKVPNEHMDQEMHLFCCIQGAGLAKA